MVYNVSHMPKKQAIKTTLGKSQIGIFFNNPVSRPDLFTQKLTSNFSELFDTAPINLPVPAEILDFPIAQLKSSNNKWQADVSRTRADVIFNPDQDRDYEDIKVEFKQLEQMMFKFVDEAFDQKVEISRVTNISSFLYVTESPVEVLQSIFLKNESKEASELVIRFNEPIIEDGLVCNNIVQYQTNSSLINVKTGKKAKGIIIMRDFNTDPKKKDIFTKKDIKTFIKIATKHSHDPRIDW